MTTTEMIAKLQNIGKEWHKGDMHRFYIDLHKAAEMYLDLPDAKHGRLPLNRYERNNGMIWIDIENGKFCTKGIQDEDELIACIDELIAHGKE